MAEPASPEANGDRSEACCAPLEQIMSPRFFKALADPRRIGILAWLASRCTPTSVGDISACCPTDLSVVSRHLAVLREAGIVSAEKKGREVFYQVRVPELARTLRAVADAIEACCVPQTSKQTTKGEQ